MFLVLFPWGSIAIINAWIISALFYNTKKFRDIEMDPKKVAEREQQDRQITRTLLMVTFTFLILLAWQCINQCFFMLKYGKSKYGYLLLYLFVIVFSFKCFGICLHQDSKPILV